jgi:prepilin peptidase CpaA
MQLTDGYVVFSNAWFVELRLLLLGAFLLAAAVIDLRRRKIPNLVVLGGLAAAFVYHVIDPSVLGWQRALAGMALGFAMLLPFYLLRGMAAGDVKLMAMVGAFIGPQATFSAVLLTFVLGGVWALLLVCWRRAWPDLRTSLLLALHPPVPPAEGGDLCAGTTQPHSTVGCVPYGVAIAAGTLLSQIVLRGGMPF